MTLLDNLSHSAIREQRDTGPAPVPQRGRVAGIQRAAPVPQVTPPELSTNYLTTMLDRADAVPETGGLGRGRLVHVSSLVDLCARQFFLVHRYEVPQQQQWTGGHKVTFALGKAAETYVRDGILFARERRGVFGQWRCSCRRTRHYGGYDAARVCGQCGHHLDNYNEPVLIEREAGIIGRPDLTLHEGAHHHKVVVEIKSISRNGWDALDAPRPDHALQALMYRWMYQRLGYRVADNVILLYVCKDWRWGSPYREFHINAHDPLPVVWVANALETARVVRQARETNTPPPRELCQDTECTRARNCPARSLCFNVG